jgi:hypothetical protein
MLYDLMLDVYICGVRRYPRTSPHEGGLVIPPVTFDTKDLRHCSCSGAPLISECFVYFDRERRFKAVHSSRERLIRSLESCCSA